MKKILILMGAYYPNPLANGICVHNIAKTLSSSGIEVHIICFRKDGEKREEKFDDIYVHRIRMRLFFLLRFWGEKNRTNSLGKSALKIALLSNKFKKIIYFPLFPMVSITFIYRYIHEAIILHKKNDFDLVLKVCKPFEATVAGSIFKKKFPKVVNVLYDLDTLTNSEYPQILPEFLYRNQLRMWEKFIYRQSDLILNLNCHKRHFQNGNYNEFANKMDYVDIPLLKTCLSNVNDTGINNDEITFLYAGTLNKKMRNPEFMCRILYEISKIINIKLNIYSRGECDDIIALYQKSSDNKIQRHDYVDKSKIDEIIGSSDILINIANKDSEMIPSKIFEYFSTGKKIIHFYSDDKDTCIPYFKKYLNSLLINYRDKDEINIKKILQFIKCSKKEITDSDLKNLFCQNTPEYTANKILKIL